MLDCLKNKKNGLLESPTGTGKTLSVLCAAMAWLEQKHEEEDASIRGSSLCEEPQDFNPLSGEGGLNFATASRPELLLKKPLRSRIIYCSRTHVQLSQAMKELNRTYYNTNPAIILGSRDQLCVHPEVRIMESNAAKTHACRLKVRQKTCQFMDNLESKVEKEFEKMEVTDIEDLTTRGIVHNFCPYYASRQLQQKSDVVFSPYNYLMDPNLRATQSIQLEKSVVIFDEGHNIESICEDTASCRLSSSALALCIQAMDPILEKMRGVEEAKNEEADILEQMDNDSLGELPITEYIFLKDVMCDLEEALDAKAIEVKNVKQNRVSVDWIIDLLDNQLKMKTTDDCQRLFQVLDRISMTFSRSVGTTAKGKSAAFDEFSSFMRVLITGRNAAGDHSFKQKYAVSLPIVDTRDRFKKAVDSKGFYSSAKQTEDHNSWNLDVLCLSPSVAMKQLLDLGVECVIITSGTLSPLDSFQNEMEVPFLVKLENRHVIESNQMLVCALSESVKGITFNSTFKNRENADYYLGLGETIIDFFRIIPDGVLIFFSSYTVLYKTIEIWKRNGMWERMDGLKEVFSEPKDRFTFQDALNKFKSVIESSSTKGSAFFGVSRGKLSEGLDVGNRYCRAVIVVGLPYPSCMDARSVLKREYIESKRDPNFTGQIYYEIQMKRSLNQAIGRVIRHKDDYGVVLLLDERFKNHRNSLSKWLQPYFVAKNYRDTRADLMTFFGVGRSNYSSLRKESKDKTPEKTKAVTISGVKREFPETPEEDVVQGYVSDSKQSKPSFSKPSPLFPIFKGQKSRSLFQPLVQKEEKTDEKETLEIEEEMISKPKKKLIVPLTSINESNVVYGAGSSCQGEGDKTNKMSLFLKEHSQMVSSH
jgi:regulator of telomere elongation helicase 1